MQIVRTIVWVLLFVVLIIFSANNWNPVEVKIWEGLVLETKIPALVVISFLLGLLPMWLLNKFARWHYNRRISSLENAARSVASTPVAPSPAPTPAPASAPAPSVAPAPTASEHDVVESPKLRPEG